MFYEFDTILNMLCWSRERHC